jgi:hypothetical protein
MWIDRGCQRADYEQSREGFEDVGVELARCYLVYGYSTGAIYLLCFSLGQMVLSATRNLTFALC